MKTFKVTILVSIVDDSHPRKWIADVINDVMVEDEQLLDWQVKEVDYDVLPEEDIDDL